MRRAAIAAAKPEGPPPTTTTSDRATIRAEPALSCIRSTESICVSCQRLNVVKWFTSGLARRRLPADHQLFDQGDGEEEHHREAGADHDGGIEHRGVERV